MKRRPIAITLLMAVLWGLYFLGRFHKLHPSKGFLIGLSLLLAIGFSGYVLYCFVKRKVFNGIAPFRGEWIQRDEDPFFYWLYMALFSFWSGVGIYASFMMITKGSL
jgi:hypothetical protein